MLFSESTSESWLIPNLHTHFLFYSDHVCLTFGGKIVVVRTLKPISRLCEYLYSCSGSWLLVPGPHIITSALLVLWLPQGPSRHQRESLSLLEPGLGPRDLLFPSGSGPR